MTGDTPADADGAETGAETEHQRAARVVDQYLDPDAEVSEATLRDHLQRVVGGDLVALSADGGEIVVTVEFPGGDDTDPVRRVYSVHRWVDLDGRPELHWSYLGHHQ
ncbi:MAG: hypothetical protein ABEH83_04815 [Halobacterium sp.]